MTSVCPACDAADFAVQVAETPMAVTLSVPDIKCAVCIGTIERKLAQTPGVKDARVNLTLKRVNISTSRSAEAMIAILAEIGFDAFAFDAAALDQDGCPITRDLLLRVGVAGFAMMNVMLLSVAVWSGATDATRDMFHLVSAAIALPAVLYSGQPFFRSALGALRRKRLNMDVPISLAILLATGMSLFESLNRGEHAYFDAALSLTFFLLIGRVLEHKTRATARSAAKELSALEVHTAKLIRGGRVQDVPTKDLKVGDMILVPSGVKVPVDGQLTSATSFTDRSFLTGESEPVECEAGATLQSGEINLGAPFEMRATAVGNDTRLRQMARLVETAENLRNRYTSLADRVAGYYAPVVHLLAGATFMGWWAVAGDPRQAINVAIAVLIITCPCALGLAVPAVSTAAIGQLYRRGFLVKSGTALERLAQVDTVLLDKTGTLTKPGFSFALSGVSKQDLSVAKALAQASSHPLSKALNQHLKLIDPAVLSDIHETPGRGMVAYYHQTPVALGRGDLIGRHGSGLVLRIGNRQVTLDHTELARDGALMLGQALKDLGINVQILSGDGSEKNDALAQRMGISNWHADQSPEDKQALVARLTEQGRNVCMIGDGINDTIALRSALVSVAPGTALDAARSASDVVMLNEGLADLPRLFQISQKAVRLYKQNFGIAFTYNLIAIPIAVSGLATPLLAALAMSSSSIIVLLNAMRARLGV